ncbi:alpha-glucan family phosphorylase [Oleiagrimonas sp. C23AA]|uniref:alpha-glucan family phosphorylase n=1 Tax=Oleiagrimonas sp. C23AA TaxID=2719047 RepID=UPI001424531C|nr:alpha-glucan family phosphorylase [Oleiagrimonas sp. C23AA]NII11083.1 glycosyltransferase family 1 protein [Oleiagrimonas sp. C23AA]
MYAFVPRALPERLSALTGLALDLRWTWNHALDALWKRIDPELWARTENPWVILQNVPQERLDALCLDDGFASELERALDDARRYHQEPGWHAQSSQAPLPGTVAFFSMEFGLSESFPLYAGGLGVLAGDYLKTASDLGVPMVGVGLLYQEGYFRQVIDADGHQREAYPYNDPTSLPIQPVIGEDGAWLEIKVVLPGRPLYLRVWQAIVGRVRLFLLDSNDVRNGASDRGITAKLYDGNQEMRLLQAVVLGIGGWVTLRELHIPVNVCHLNEGHAALLVLERARQFMRDHGVSFWEAWWTTRAGNVFTTHTPVPAGMEAFAPALISKYASDYLTEFDIPPRDLLGLGRRDRLDDSEPFSTTYLALRGCAQCNGVSRLHGEVSRHLFADLYPRWPLQEVPIRHVTNGVHVPSWDSVWSDRVWTHACGKQRWLGPISTLESDFAATDDETLWQLACDQRRDLVMRARERLAWQLGQRGESASRVAACAQVLDPNILTLGLARRFAEYKRPNLMLHDAERLLRLITDATRPVQLIVAGKAHPDDEKGKQLVHAWLSFAHRAQVHARVVFLEDYDMALAQQMVQGVDLWINTPRRPWEACGTSGMKVLVNGGLNVSELDGWWAEAYRPELGWAIGDDSDTDYADDAEHDAHDAERLYRLLEQDIVPAFYDRDAKGLPRRWIALMRASMARLAPAYSSNRMLLEYVEHFYRPAAQALQQRVDGGVELGRRLCAWHTTLAAQWHELHFGALDVIREQDDWLVSVPVYLGEIEPGHVRVELCAQAQGDLPAECVTMTPGRAMPGAVEGHVYSARVPATRPAEHFTARVRAWHPDAFLPAESALIAWPA